MIKNRSYKELAECENISERTYLSLWSNGDSWVRSTLCKKDTIPESVKKEILNNDNYIYYWSQNKSRSSKDLTVAVKSAKSNNTHVMLIGQVNISNPDLEIISRRVIRNNDSNLAGFLLDRNDIHRKTRDKLIKLYINKSTTPKIDELEIYKQHIRRLLFTNSDDAIIALKSADWDKEYILEYACNYVENKYIRRELIKKILLLNNEGREFIKDREKSINYIIKSLIGCYALSKSEINNLLKSKIAPQGILLERSYSSISQNYKTLKCTLGEPCPPSEKLSHLIAIEILYKERLNLRIPIKKIAVAALTHFEDIDKILFKDIISDLMGEDSRELADKISEVGEYKLLYNYIEIKGLYLYKNNKYRDQLIEDFAKLGSKHINSRDCSLEELRNVIYVLEPLKEYLNDKVIASIFLEELDRCRDATFNTVLSLSNEWQGSLKDLVILAEKI